MKDTSQNLTIMMITHVVPFPPAAGNEIRILRMLKWLKKEEYKIVLLLNVDSLEPRILNSLEEIVDAVHLVGNNNRDTFYRSMINKVNSKIGVHFLNRAAIGKYRDKKIMPGDVKKSLASPKLLQLTRQLCLKYNPFAVIAEYIFTSPCLDVVPPGVLKVIDTHDMFSRKKDKVICYGIEDRLHCTPEEERGYLLKGDVIISIQPEETQMFKELVPEREIMTIGIDYDVVKEIDNSRIVPHTILVVGSDNPLNVHGLKEFYKNAWPYIRSKSPDAVLRIAGKIGNQLKFDDEQLQIVGWVEDLDEEYLKAAVVINPTVAGTGLKIKSVEALCKGKPLVTTPNSAEGLFFTGDPPFIVCNNWGEFAKVVLMLLESEDQRLKLQKRALQYARDNFSSEIYAPLSQKLRSI